MTFITQQTHKCLTAVVCLQIWIEFSGEWWHRAQCRCVSLFISWDGGFIIIYRTFVCLCACMCDVEDLDSSLCSSWGSLPSQLLPHDLSSVTPPKPSSSSLGCECASLCVCVPWAPHITSHWTEPWTQTCDIKWTEVETVINEVINKPPVFSFVSQIDSCNDFLSQKPQSGWWHHSRGGQPDRCICSECEGGLMCRAVRSERGQWVTGGEIESPSHIWTLVTNMTSHVFLCVCQLDQVLCAGGCVLLHQCTAEVAHFSLRWWTEPDSLKHTHNQQSESHNTDTHF